MEEEKYQGSRSRNGHKKLNISLPTRHINLLDIISNDMPCLRTTGDLFRSIPTDLKDFDKKEALFLTLFGALMVVFSIFDFNHILGLTEAPHALKWNNDAEMGMEKWRRVLMTVSGAASFTGAMSVVLFAKGKLSAYFWGIINTVLYGAFAWAYGYAGDAQLNIFFFLPFQFIGISKWVNQRDREDNAISLSMSWGQRVLSLLFTVALGVGFYYEIPAFSKWLTDIYFFEDSPAPHILDAASNALSVTAQILLILRMWEQWVFWIVVDFVQIAMFAGVAGFGVDFNILCMWSLFLLNAFYGLRTWWKRKNTQVRSLTV